MKLIKQMKLRYKHIFLSVALLTGGCSKEAPFNIVTEEGEGQILKSALNVDLRDGELAEVRVAILFMMTLKLRLQRMGLRHLHQLIVMVTCRRS